MNDFDGRPANAFCWVGLCAIGWAVVLGLVLL